MPQSGHVSGSLPPARCTFSNDRSSAESRDSRHVRMATSISLTATRQRVVVDPANRLVADALEADWNHKLRELAAAQDDHDRARQAGAGSLTEEQQARIRALASDLPALWRDPATPTRERKRLIRLLITDVTLLKTDEHVTAHVRLPGGQQHTLTVPRPLTAWEQHTTPEATVALIDDLLAEHTYDETAAILNERGLTSGWGKPFTVPSLTALCRARNIPSLCERLRDAGMLTLDEIAGEFGVTPDTIKRWQRRGAITGRRVDGRRAYLYHPGQIRPPDGRSTRYRANAGNVGATGQHEFNPVPDSNDPATSPGGAV